MTTTTTAPMTTADRAAEIAARPVEWRQGARWSRAHLVDADASTGTARIACTARPVSGSTVTAVSWAPRCARCERMAASLNVAGAEVAEVAPEVAEVAPEVAPEVARRPRKRRRLELGIRYAVNRANVGRLSAGDMFTVYPDGGGAFRLTATDTPTGEPVTEHRRRGYRIPTTDGPVFLPATAAVIVTGRRY